MTTEGVSWNWLYKDALPVKAKIPKFDVQGRKSLLSLVLGRPKFSSTQASQQQCNLFVFLSLARTSQFAKDLQSKQKTSVILSKHTQQIHVFTTCTSLEEFDKNTTTVPSGINVWCDLNGQVAEAFGMKPMAPEENLDLFNYQTKTKYSKQTIAGFIVCIKDTIVKSPAYQPKLQVASISNIASAIQSLESVGFDVEKASASGTYASSLSERELQLSQSEAWAAYQKEYQTMVQYTRSF